MGVDLLKGSRNIYRSTIQLTNHTYKTKKN